jgi:hypothetical protein
MIGGKILDRIEIDLRDFGTKNLHTLYIDVDDNSLSKKWLTALNHLLVNSYHLEKNYCFFGFANSTRNGQYILNQINLSIAAINNAKLGYTINDYFTVENTLSDDPKFGRPVGRNIIQDHFNQLHRYFEDLQGISGSISHYYQHADATIKWHIRQLNLLCHEFESWALSYRKQLEAPEWQRPSQLMCWLNAPRFKLEEQDYELFGIETINRPVGGVFVGVNKAVGKHHWEVFNDEGRDSRIDELTTTTMRGQTEAAGDFDIEWGRDPGHFAWQVQKLNDFKQWLINNGFDPDDKSLTIGHPQVGQVDLTKSFNSNNLQDYWSVLNTHLDVYAIRTSDSQSTFDYHWSDTDFISKQIKIISQGY